MEVIAVDVAKLDSMVGCFSLEGIIDPDKKGSGVKAVAKPKKVTNDWKGIEYFLSLGGSKKPKVIMESTGGFHVPLARHLREKGFDVIVINPLFSANSNIDLRETKTDKEDCIKLGMLYFKGEYNRTMVRSQDNERAVSLARYSERIQKEATAIKNDMRNQLLLSFPEMERMSDSFGLFGSGMLRLIARFPHASMYVKKNRKRMVSEMAKACPQHSKDYEGIVDRLISSAADSFACIGADDPVCTFIIPSLARRLICLKAEIEKTEDALNGLVKESPLYRVLSSFDGVGRGIASHLTAEIGDMSRFESYKSLVAYAGLSPKKNESGSSVNSNGKITKRGDRHLRHWLFLAVQSMIQQKGRGKDNDVEAYYRKKRSDGKHHYAAAVACCNKLARKIFYRYRSETQGPKE